MVHNLEVVFVTVMVRNASHIGHRAVLLGKEDSTSLLLEDMLVVSSGGVNRGRKGRQSRS